MKPFFLTSILLHGILLLFCFAWEMPLAKKFSSGDIIQVSLVPKIDNEEPREAIPSPKKAPKKTKLPEARETPPIRENPEIIKEEITGKKKEPASTVLQEEKTKETDKAVPDRELAKPPFEQPLRVQAKASPPLQENGDAAGLKSPLGGEQNALARRDSGETLQASFILSAALKTEGGVRGKEPVKESASAKKREGNANPSGKIHSFPAEVDGILQQIVRKIEAAKRYPGAARKMGIEGRTVVRFKLKPQGQVEAVEIAESSGSPILDRASLQTVRDAVPLPYKEGWLKVGIVFKIL